MRGGREQDKYVRGVCGGNLSPRNHGTPEIGNYHKAAYLETKPLALTIREKRENCTYLEGEKKKKKVLGMRTRKF